MIRTSDLKDLSNLEWLVKKGNRSYIQNLIFTTFHRVLESMQVTEGTAIGLILVQFIQLSVMTANSNDPSLTKVLPATFLYYLRLPLLYPFLKDFQYTYTTIAIVPICLFICISIYLFFRIYNLSEKSHKDFAGMKSFFGLSMYMFDTVLVPPLFGTCFKYTLCSNTSSLLPNCSSSTYIISLLVSILLLVSMFFLEMVVGMFFFNFDFKLRDNFSRSYNIMHLVFRIFSLLVVGFDVYMPEGSNTKIVAGYFMHLVFAGVFCIDYYNRLPYYNRTVSEFYCYGVFGYFWITLVLIMTYLANYSLTTTNVVWIILVGLVFWLYLVRTYREYFYRRLIIKEIDEIDNEIHLDARFRYLLQIVKDSTKNKQDELLLTSIIKVHTEKCQDVQCVCKRREELYDPKTKTESDKNLQLFKNHVFIKNYLLSLIKDSCKKLPKSSLLNIDLFLFLFKEMNNISQVNHNIILFEKQSQQNLFVTVNYAIYRVKISIYYFLKDRNKNNKISSIMFENIRVFDEEMKNLSKSCIRIVELYARMWDILSDGTELGLLERVCMKLIDERSIAEDTYRKINEVTKNSINFLTLMVLYSKFIVFDDLLYSEIRERLTKLTSTGIIEDSVKNDFKEFKRQFISEEFGRHLINMDGPFCSIAISFNQENLGGIVWSSESCQQILDYESNYIRTVNVAHILPPVLAKHHNRFLQTYFNFGREHFMNNINHVWAYDKSKNLFSIFLLLKMYIAKEGLSVNNELIPR